MSVHEKIVTIIVLLLSIIFLLNVGFATDFEEEYINSNNIDSIFNTEFLNAKILDTYGTNNINITISEDNKNLTINNLDLEYPGAYAKFSIDTVNKGKEDAKIERLIVNGFENTDTVSFKFLNEKEIYSKVLKPNEVCTICFVIKWNESATIIQEESLNFSIQIPCYMNK